MSEQTLEQIKKFFLEYLPDVKKIIFNYPATILIFKNNEKSIVKHKDEDYNDPEKAVLFAYVKYKVKQHKQLTLRRNLWEICTKKSWKKKVADSFAKGGIVPKDKTIISIPTIGNECIFDKNTWKAISEKNSNKFFIQ